VNLNGCERRSLSRFGSHRHGRPACRCLALNRSVRSVSQVLITAGDGGKVSGQLRSPVRRAGRWLCRTVEITNRPIGVNLMAVIFEMVIADCWFRNATAQPRTA
jgi:hypothetical protein